MTEFWKDAVDSVTGLLTKMPFHDPLLNERHLHHFFSHEIRAKHPDWMNLLGPATAMRLHPEWPTYKEAANLAYGKYREVDGEYRPVNDGKKGGFIDFAIGPYAAPEVAVEFKCSDGLKRKATTFDYIKLLDRRNPFHAVLQVTVLLRPNGLAEGGDKKKLQIAMNTAYHDAVRQLGDDHRPKPGLIHRFVVTELAKTNRRHWCLGEGFDEMDETWGVPE